jgi:hypothetical protein
LQRAAVRAGCQVISGRSGDLANLAQGASSAVLLIDDVSTGDDEGLAEVFRSGRGPVVLATEPQGLSHLLEIVAQRNPSLRLQVIELLPFETSQIREVIQRRQATCMDPKVLARLHAFEGFLESAQLSDSYGDLPSCPLFLRLILDLVESSGLPRGRFDRARLVREWTASHARGNDEGLAAAVLHAVGLSQELGEAPESSPTRRGEMPIERRRHRRRPRVEPATPPDLEIRVLLETEAGAHRLRYILHAPTGRVDFFHRSLPGPILDAAPEAYSALLRERIESLGLQTDLAGAPLLAHETRRELDNLGRELYHRLFPAEMRSAYRSFRGAVRTLQIVSDEPWIPWEWVRPYDDSDRANVIDDDFLCLRFRLARWLADSGRPAEAIRVRSIAPIEAGEVAPRLPHAAEERVWLKDLASRHGIPVAELAGATHPQVIARLAQGGISLFHFVGHAQCDPSRPERSGFRLVDGRSFRPLDLQGGVQTRLKEARPLVFFNACESTQQGWGPSGLDGWVAQWIHGCGCGALIGPQWNVSDGLALCFAKSFYSSLARGATFAQATRAARRALRRTHPGHPSWLAFVLYAHPNGRLLLGPP